MTALSPILFNDILRKAPRNANIDCLKYSTHSFRRGGTTFASSAGASAESLKAQGNWRSDCYERYVARDFDLRLEFVKKIQDALPAFP